MQQPTAEQAGSLRCTLGDRFRADTLLKLVLSTFCFVCRTPSFRLGISACSQVLRVGSGSVAEETCWVLMIGSRLNQTGAGSFACSAFGSWGWMVSKKRLLGAREGLSSTDRALGCTGTAEGFPALRNISRQCSLRLVQMKWLSSVRLARNGTFVPSGR